MIEGEGNRQAATSFAKHILIQLLNPSAEHGGSLASYGGGHRPKDRC